MISNIVSSIVQVTKFLSVFAFLVGCLAAVLKEWWL